MESPDTARAPRHSTYRLQLHSGFTFDDASAVVGYLSRLGISHVYLSPVLQAAAGSTHGYDVVDPTLVNRELGGEPGHLRFQEALGGVGLAQILDVVPNHMAVNDSGNRWWWDVLENGPASVYADHFDVDWNPPESKLRDVVLLPILGDHYGRELEAGHMRVERHGGYFTVVYFDHRVPVSPRSLDTLIFRAAVHLPESVDISLRAELESLATAFGRLPPSWAKDRASMAERHRDKTVLAERLGRLCEQYPEIAASVDRQLADLNADVDDLDSLLERQNYRLAWWRTADEELDYRRFFDINDLVAIRAEDEAVFADSHALIASWLTSGVIDGVRVDHVDGLRDPHAYLQRLRDASGDAWVLVEKILEDKEELPVWPVEGTTGYDWLNQLMSMLLDDRGMGPLVASYLRITGFEISWDELVRLCKRAVLNSSLAADLNRLVGRFSRVCERHRRYRDYTRRDLRDCLAELISSYDVYRTYVATGEQASEQDKEVVARAVATTLARRPDLDAELLTFFRDVLLGAVPGEEELEASLRFQQLTGPVMAKAVEDTAFYRYMPLVALNEVGADPGRPGLSVSELHEICALRAERFPFGMLATSTHDTKRSEDVRARTLVLAEMSHEWVESVERWMSLSANLRAGEMPDPNTEWLLYQTVVGAWPIDVGRLCQYLEKAVREAKVHTSWTDQDSAYEEAVRDLAHAILEDDTISAEISAFAERITRPGWVNSLSQKLITLTAPGIPDIYQGTERWDLSLVDPDNRRPVDYADLEKILDEVESLGEHRIGELWAAESGDGATKIALVKTALRVRRENQDAFEAGAAYQPLWASGPASEHMFGFLRGGRVITVATRLPVGLETNGGWRDTTVALPEGLWKNRLGTGVWSGNVSLEQMLGELPVALLTFEANES